jgi:RimJ/RimL family protein N-acetyltransferase
MVIMGGSDPQELTARVLQALSSGRLEDLEVTVVVGGSNPHLEKLQNLAAQSELKISVRQDVSNMAELMASADVAISAAGSTCWELCLLGLPALLVDVAANQTALAKELDRRGCAIHIGDRAVTARTIADQLKSLSGSYELRQSLSRRCRELVDGRGASRVADILLGREIRLRRVREEDRRLLWEWANDRDVRAASFSSDSIAWETHVAWFADKVTSSESLLFIAEDKAGTPFGQIRFDLTKNGGADLNLSLVREKRGCGLAVPLIRAGVRELFSSTECKRVHAFVKPENIASARAFEKAGFLRVGNEIVRAHDAIRFDLERK